jgi:type IV pilus assembly protein PilZ
MNWQRSSGDPAAKERRKSGAKAAKKRRKGHSMAAKRGARNGILSLAIKDKAVLYAAYMPFIQNGGLFIPTEKEYEIGDEVFMLLSLMDEPEKLPVAGKVVWVTPKGAGGTKAAGIGVQFNDQDDVARSKIETYLAGALQSDRHTHTM